MFYSAVRIIRTVFRIIHLFSHYFVQWICDYLDDFLEELISKYDTTAISKTLDNHQKDDLKSRNSEKYKKKSDVSCNGSFYTKAEYFKTVATYSEINKSVEGDSIRIESLNATDYEVLNSEMHISNLNICFHGSDNSITSELNNTKTVTLPYKFSCVNIKIISGDCIQNKASNSTNNGIESEEKTSVKLEPRTCVTICNSDINKEFPNGNKITESDINNSRAGGKETDIINSSNLSSYNNIPLKSDVLEPKTVNHTTDVSKIITVKNHNENLTSVDSEETEISCGSSLQEIKQFSHFLIVSIELENSGETVQEMDGFELHPCCLPAKENAECLKETTFASRMNESPKMSPDGKHFSKDLDALKLTADNQQNNKIFQENRDLMEDMVGDTQARNGYDRRCNLEMSYESQVNNDVETEDLCTTAVCDSETRASTPNGDFNESSHKIPMTTPTESPINPTADEPDSDRYSNSKSSLCDGRSTSILPEINIENAASQGAYGLGLLLQVPCSEDLLYCRYPSRWLTEKEELIVDKILTDMQTASNAEEINDVQTVSIAEKLKNKIKSLQENRKRGK